MRKLQKIALSAFVVLLSVSFTSCTKDLEDRMDKVEKDVAQLITDVKELKDKLATLSTQASGFVTDIAEAKRRLDELEKPENNTTQEELNNAKKELEEKITAAAGKYTYTLSEDKKTLTMKWTDGDGVSQEFSYKASSETSKVVVLKEGDEGYNPLFTTMIVDGTSYTFPNMDTFNSNVTEIVLLSDNLSLILLEGEEFKQNYYFNTVGGASAVVTEDQLQMVVNLSTRALSALEAQEMVKVKSIARVGETNEFEVTFKVGALSSVFNKNLRLQLKSGSKALAGGLPVSVEVLNVPDFSKVDYTLGATTATFGTSVADFGAQTVYITDGDPVATNLKVGTKRTATTVNGKALVDDKFSSMDVKVYMLKAAGTTSGLALILDKNIDKTTFDGQNETAGAFGKWVADNATEVAGVANIDATSNVVFNTLKAAESITETDKEATFVVVLTGNAKTYNGKYFRYAGEYKLKKEFAYFNTNSNETFKPTGITEVLNGKYAFSATYTNKSNNELTGNIDINDYTVSSIVVKDNDGKIVTGAAAPTLNPIGIEGLGYLSYKANLDVAKLPKGAYTLEYTIEYPVAGVTPTAYKKMTFVQEFKVEDLTVAPATWTNLSGDNAWVVTGTTVKNFVYNSITPMNAAVNGTLVSDVTVANILPLTYSGFEGLTTPSNYKLIYRLYSVVNGAKVYNDGKTDAELLTEYTASTNQAAKLTVVHGTEDVNNSTIKSNVEYGVDIIVILSGDNTRRYTLSGVSTVKYATTPEIKLFKKFAADAATLTELEYEIKLDAASNLDMSYVTSNDKPFYLTDGSGKVALIAADNSAQTSMFNRSLSTIEYEIQPLSAADVAKLKTSTDAEPTNKPTSLIAFTSIPDGGSLTNVQALVKDAAKLVMHSKVAASGADKVSKIVDATNPTVSQVIKVKVTDIWGRKTELKITVKIVNK